LYFHFTRVGKKRIKVFSSLVGKSPKLLLFEREKGEKKGGRRRGNPVSTLK